MGKHLTVIFLILIIILLFLIFSYYQPQVNGDVFICSKIEDQNIKNHCFAIIGQNESLCGEIEAGRLTDLKQEGCYYDLAVVKMDESICAKIDSTYMKSLCFEKIGKLKLDVLICGMALEESDRDSCYVHISTKTNNLSLCEKVNDALWKRFCYEHITVETNSTSLCDKIVYGNQNDTQDTINFCYMSITNDASYCEKINDKNYRNSCYYDIANKTQNESLCHKINNNEEMKNLCLAYLTNNSYYCSKIKYKDFCYEEIATRTINATVCDRIEDHDYRYTCYYRVTNETQYCEYMSEEGKDDCYHHFAAYIYVDESMCELIESSYRRANCYERIAIKKRDPSICENVPQNLEFEYENETRILEDERDEGCYLEIIRETHTLPIKRSLYQ